MLDIDISQPMTAVVRNVLAVQNKPMTIVEIAAAVDALGYKHGKRRTYDVVKNALKRRRDKHHDIGNIVPGTWRYIPEAERTPCAEVPAPVPSPEMSSSSV